MTARFVPLRSLRRLQILALTVSAVLGASILLTPTRADVHLSEIEQGLGTDAWGWLLIIFGAAGVFAEAWMWCRNSDTLVTVVGVCHVVLAASIGALTVSALVAVFLREPSNFGAPALGVLISYLHLIYVRRRPLDGARRL